MDYQVSGDAGFSVLIKLNACVGSTYLTRKFDGSDCLIL